MRIDEATENYFNNVQQVFLYLSDECNLLCEQCLYKPNVVLGKAIKPNTAKSLLSVFRRLGAYKLTILGGEISLYDIKKDWVSLIDILKYARNIGYKYIRIDTNGQVKHFFKKEEIFNLLDEVSFSIDGYDSNSNDILRGEGTFEKAIDTLTFFRDNYPSKRLNITSCVTRQNTKIAGSITDFINKMIEFADEKGVTQINFHGVFEMGVPMDTWTGDSHLDPMEWYKQVKSLKIIDNKDGKVDVRFPVHVITHEEFSENPAFYGYCPCKLGERALIHPDGIIRVCSSMLSTPYGVAHYNDDEVVWNKYNNELINHKMDEYTPCTNQQKLYSDMLCPVCFSIKPNQDEIVWKNSRVDDRREGII